MSAVHAVLEAAMALVALGTTALLALVVVMAGLARFTGRAAATRAGATPRQRRTRRRIERRRRRRRRRSNSRSR